MINNSYLQVHNKFELKLLDEQGNLLQEGYAYNAANSLKFIANGLKWYSGSDRYWISSLALGDGDMTTNPPTDKDKHMVHKLFSSNINNYEFQRISPFKKEYDTLEFHSAEHIFPATSDYVGELSEIGITGFNCLFSHAALVDIEGNPIIIHKTEYNILKVTIIWYITPILTLPNNELNFKFFPAYASTLGGCLGYHENSISLFYLQYLPSAQGGWTFYFSPQYVPESTDGIIYDNPMSTLESYSDFTTSANRNATTDNLIVSDGTNTFDYSPAFPFTFTANNILFTQKQKNFGFAHSIIFPGLGAISLPNKKIIPTYTLDVNIGVGDGEKTIFFTSVNELALDENNQPILKVYFQTGTEGEKNLVDPSEYCFTNFNVKKSPLWNKMIYVEDNKGNKVDKNSFFIEDYRFYVGYCALTNYGFAVNKQIDWASNHNNHNNFIAPGRFYSPIYYDAQGITLDEAKIGSYYNGASSDAWFNPILYLYYKNSEEENWTEENKIIIPASSLDPNEFIFTKFDSITAKYWKLMVSGGTYYYDAGRISVQGSNRLGKCTMSGQDMEDNQVYGMDPNYIVVGNSAEYDFSKVGLTFKTPPPAGTIITMEATLDLPYKTPDGSMTFSYQATLNAPTSS